MTRGRVSRRLALAAMARVGDAQPPAVCVMCERPLGRRTEWHHLVPKSEGGRVTAPLHPICHRAIHAHLTNAELARDFAEPEALRQHPALARFIRWVAARPPDFTAPTRRRRPD